MTVQDYPLEPLPRDGARWQCGFRTFLADETGKAKEWRCDREAAGLLPEEVDHAAERMTHKWYRTVFLSGRAYCQPHANLVATMAETEVSQ